MHDCSTIFAIDSPNLPTSNAAELNMVCVESIVVKFVQMSIKAQESSRTLFSKANRIISAYRCTLVWYVMAAS